MTDVFYVNTLGQEPQRDACVSSAPTREELIEFVRAICEGDVPVGSSGKVHGVRAIELAAWNLYRRLQEANEL